MKHICSIIFTIIAFAISGNVKAQENIVVQFNEILRKSCEDISNLDGLKGLVKDIEKTHVNNNILDYLQELDGVDFDGINNTFSQYEMSLRKYIKGEQNDRKMPDKIVSYTYGAVYSFNYSKLQYPLNKVFEEVLEETHSDVKTSEFERHEHDYHLFFDYELKTEKKTITGSMLVRYNIISGTHYSDKTPYNICKITDITELERSKIGALSLYGQKKYDEAFKLFDLYSHKEDHWASHVYLAKMLLDNQGCSHLSKKERKEMAWKLILHAREQSPWDINNSVLLGELNAMYKRFR